LIQEHQVFLVLVADRLQNVGVRKQELGDLDGNRPRGTSWDHRWSQVRTASDALLPSIELAVAECGDGVQCPNDSSPILFISQTFFRIANSCDGPLARHE